MPSHSKLTVPFSAYNVCIFFLCSGRCVYLLLDGVVLHEKLIMNIELEIIWKEEVLTKANVLYILHTIHGKGDKIFHCVTSIRRHGIKTQNPWDT
jgi:hypothetical protein